MIVNIDAARMLKNLCDVILDNPCGCDCCCYKETMNEETGECAVSNMIRALESAVE